MKPIIYFRGVRYKAGTHEGWRPSLETAKKETDYAFAERVVLERGLTMSPDELLLAVRSTLECAPQFVAADGMNREITGALRWTRSASGRLEGETSPWNDTCAANVRASLAKEAKATVDATFRNSITAFVPKIDNVTWVGAAGVTNVVKVGENFAAYGRCLKMCEGDSAALAVEGRTYPLTCCGSDTASATFYWPDGLDPEPGALATFELHSRGGNPDGPFYTLRKKVTAIGGTALTTIDAVRQEGRADDTVGFDENSPFTAVGKNLLLGTGDRVLVELYDEDEAELLDDGDCTGKVTANTKNAIALSGFVYEMRERYGRWLEQYPHTKLVVVKDGVRYVHPIQLVSA